MIITGIHLLADNIPTHSSPDMVEELIRCNFEILLYQTYFPDFTQSDVFIFREIGKILWDWRFDNTNGIV